MHFKLMLFLILTTSTVSADDGEKVLNGYDPKTDIISEKYEAGPYLIYDCKDKHFTCVLESYYKECELMRAQDNHHKKVELSCAPIAQMQNKKSCFQQQLFFVSQNQGTKFCVGESWKQKELDI
jgi:hypothetical protein